MLNKIVYLPWNWNILLFYISIIFILFAEMDKRKQCLGNCVTRLLTPASIRGETRKNSTIHHQRESSDFRGFRCCMGCSSRKTWRNCEKCSRFTRKIGLGFLAGAIGSFIQLLSGQISHCISIDLMFTPKIIERCMFWTLQASWSTANKKQTEKLLELIRRLAEDDKDGVMAHKVRVYFYYECLFFKSLLVLCQYFVVK